MQHNAYTEYEPHRRVKGKRTEKNGAKKRVQNLIFQTIPMEFIYISQKKILKQMHFV